MPRAVLIVVLLAACSSDSSAPPPPQPPPQPIADAGAAGTTQVHSIDPSSGMHLDDDSTPARGKKQARQGPPIGILLKSTPTGATIFVDGRHFGVTPKYWNDVADGSEHEFAFAMPKYALARYRFVPITSGTLHATLERTEVESLDAGLAPKIAPTFAPDAALAPPPPVIAPPIDAAPLAPAPDAETTPAIGPQP